ncbi:MAG TPA: AAA family ATPase, partial [Polyangiales bacterium]|nr:AAA family ATPase [Polyangiales bacterium]
MIWTFANFELDERNCVLLRDGEPVSIRRRVFAVLHYLLAHSGALVTKEELLANVWPNESTVEAVLPQNIAILRQLLGDDHKNGRFIQTVHGRGYRFIAPVTRGSAPPMAAEPSACIGREHVLSELVALISVACSGTGQSIVLQGDPGIGKTTLLHEVGEQARARGVLVLDAHCQDATGAPSFWPWQQVLRPLIAQTGREPGPELSRLLGEATTPEGTERDSRAASEARFRMFDRITALIAEASSKQPIMLTFDDLHWADHASIQLLSFVARELRRWPIVLLGTVRTLQVAMDDVAQATLATWLASSHVRLTNLRGLTEAATAQLARQVLGQELKPEWLSDVHEITDGNPFHVQQWARLLQDDIASGRSASAPLRLREVIALRITRLGARVEHVLTRAAIIGRSFNVAVLDQLSDGTRAEVLTALSAALDARIIQRAGKPTTRVGWYEFSHALIQEVLYDRVPHADRTRMHFEIGRALEAISGLDAEPSVHLLAHHFYQAAVSGNPARAVHYCRLAAEQSFGQLAFEHAVAWFRAALSALALQLP